MPTPTFTPLTVNQSIAVIPLHSDAGRCYALADPGEAQWLVTMPWFRHRRTGYPTWRRADGTLLTMHQVLMGTSPRGMVVDHINGDKLDCRRTNLRVVTIAANGLNRHRPNRNNRSSRYVGVSFSRREQKWRVQIRWNGHDHHGGYFVSEEAAAAAAAQLRQRLASQSGQHSN